MVAARRRISAGRSALFASMIAARMTIADDRLARRAGKHCRRENEIGHGTVGPQEDCYHEERRCHPPSRRQERREARRVDEDCDRISRQHARHRRQPEQHDQRHPATFAILFWQSWRLPGITDLSWLPARLTAIRATIGSASAAIALRSNT